MPTSSSTTVIHKAVLTDHRAYNKGAGCAAAGGNSGIGTETVKALAGAGARVVFTARSADVGEAVAKELRSVTNNVRRALPDD